MARKNGNSAPAQTVTGIRKDIYVYNEATGFLITTDALAGKGYEPGDAKWEKQISKGKLIPVELYQDDPFIIRVVVDEPLTEQELQEWTGKFQHKLQIGDERLVVCGGIEYVMEPREEDEDSWTEDFAQSIELPPGNYLATLYTYFNSVNGEPLLRAAEAAVGAEPEALGPYFRRTREGEEFPEWISYRLKNYPNDDPDHGTEWQNAEYKNLETNFCDFLLHLTTLPKNSKVQATEPVEGFFNLDMMEARKPEQCPLGILAENVQNLPGEVVEVPKIIQGVDVFSWISDRPLSKLEKPVELPLREFASVYAMAWYVNDNSHPELRVKTESAQEIALPDRTQFITTPSGTRVFRFERDASRWGTLSQMYRLAEKLREFEFPDGSVIDFVSKGTDLDEEPGWIRLRGVTQSNKWFIEETFPQISHENLAEILRLAVEASDGKTLTMLDTAVVKDAHDYFESVWGGLYELNSPTLLEDKLVVPGEPDCSLMHLWLKKYFIIKFRGVLPIIDFDEDEIAEMEAFRREKAAAETVYLEAPSGRKYFSAEVDNLEEDAVAEFESFDQALGKLGALKIGELACSQFKGFVFRYYFLPDTDCRAVIYRNDYMSATLEFIADFADGFSLSTSTKSIGKDDPKAKLFRRGANGQSPGDAYKTFTKALKELASAHGGVSKFPPEIVECAKKFEEGILRQQP